MTDPLPICPTCKALPAFPCTAVDGGPLPGPHPERMANTPIHDALASAPPKPYAGADHGDWSLRAYDDDPEGDQYLRLVWIHKGAVVAEGRCYTYKVWTVLAHWTEALPELEGASRG